uniref:Uncharacterized protein n=1 Tax=Aegilops tauschii subsp. strangulata TaxID=200361 RepID=A0A453M485_AEGTS
MYFSLAGAIFATFASALFLALLFIRILFRFLLLVACFGSALVSFSRALHFYLYYYLR